MSNLFGNVPSSYSNGPYKDALDPNSPFNISVKIGRSASASS